MPIIMHANCSGGTAVFSLCARRGRHTHCTVTLETFIALAQDVASGVGRAGRIIAASTGLTALVSYSAGHAIALEVDVALAGSVTSLWLRAHSILIAATTFSILAKINLITSEAITLETFVAGASGFIISNFQTCGSAAAIAIRRRFTRVGFDRTNFAVTFVAALASALVGNT
jgi:hypothetical protein